MTHAPPKPQMRRVGAGNATPVSHSSSFSLSPPLNKPSPPDLQALVLAHGTWDRIPAEAWRDYDAHLAAFRAAIRDGVRWHQPTRGGEKSQQFDNSNLGATAGDMLRGE
jgi:hypothetical protein